MAGVLKPIDPARKRKLSAGMTLRAFDNGYWYAEELRAFAIKMRIPFASKLRKDQLETAVKNLLFANGATVGSFSMTPKQGPRDVDRGLRLDLPVVHYTSNRETKAFIEREAAKIQPRFQACIRDALSAQPMARRKNCCWWHDHVPRPGASGDRSQREQARSFAARTRAIHELHLRLYGGQSRCATRRRR